MSVQEQLILLSSKPETYFRPIYGSGKGQMWIADDFDEPLEAVENT